MELVLSVCVWYGIGELYDHALEERDRQIATGFGPTVTLEGTSSYLL